MVVYALDIGGSSVKHALINTDQMTEPFVKAYQPLQLISRDFKDLKNQVSNSVHEVLQANPFIDTVAISTTGGVDPDGTVINAGHFIGYSNISWDHILREENGRLKRVLTVNDGKAAAWAEYTNVSQNVNHFVHFVVGTGIGGATIIDRKIVIGDGGFAGYLGHIKITNEDTVVCSCGKTGCVETVAAAPAIIRYFAANQWREKNSSEVTLQDVVVASRGGNEVAERAFKVAGEYLGIAVSNVMNILNPGVITIGGGTVLAAEESKREGIENPYLKAVIESVNRHAHKRVVATSVIRQARFGNNGGIIGAAMLARQFGKPAP